MEMRRKSFSGETQPNSRLPPRHRTSIARLDSDRQLARSRTSRSSTSLSTSPRLPSPSSPSPTKSIRGCASFGQNDTSSLFLVRLATTSSLDTLTLDSSQPNEDGTLGTLPDEWSSFDWDSGPSPKRLKIDVGEGPFELSEWRLVEGMSRRLEVLEMVVGEEGLSNAPPVLPSLVATFPHLHTLRLTAGASVITKLLPAWSASPLKSLTLSLTSLALAHVADDSPLADALEPHLSTLSSAIITFPARLYTPTSPRLQKRVKFCAARNIGTATHNLDQDFSLSHLSRGVVSDVAKRKYHTGVACCAMDKVLEFAQARLARLRLDGDLEGAEEMLPLLERIAERLAVQRD